LTSPFAGTVVPTLVGAPRDERNVVVEAAPAVGNSAIGKTHHPHHDRHDRDAVAFAVPSYSLGKKLDGFSTFDSSKEHDGVAQIATPRVLLETERICSSNVEHKEFLI